MWKGAKEQSREMGKEEWENKFQERKEERESIYNLKGM